MGKYQPKQVNILFPVAAEFAEVCALGKQRGVSLSRLGRRLLLEFLRNDESIVVDADCPPGSTPPAEQTGSTAGALLDRIVETVRFLGHPTERPNLIYMFVSEGEDAAAVSLAIDALVKSGRLAAEGAEIKTP